MNDCQQSRAGRFSRPDDFAIPGLANVAFEIAKRASKSRLHGAALRMSWTVAL